MSTTTLAVAFYNQKNWVESLINDCLMQDADTIIFSDDASTDGTYEEICRVLSEQKSNHIAEIKLNHNSTNLGIANHVNLLIKLIHSDYFTIVAGDDRLDESYVAKLRDNFSKNITAVTANQFRMNDNGVIFDKSNWTNKDLKPIGEIIQSEAFGVPSAGTMFRTSTIKKYGDIIANVVNEDDQLLLRAAIEGERLILPEALFYYRVHSNSMSAVHRNYVMTDNMLLESKQKEFINRIRNIKGWVKIIDDCVINEDSRTSLKNMIDNKIDYYEKRIYSNSRLDTCKVSPLRSVQIAILYRLPALYRSIKFSFGVLVRALLGRL